MRKYDTVIFDLDGTLLDTLADLTASVNYALARHGFPARPAADIRRFLGNGAARLIELSLPDGLASPGFEACLADFRTHYAANMLNQTTPYQGIMPLIQRLSAENYRLAIVSNKFDAAVKGLNKIFFETYIRVAIGEAAGVLKKPAPDTIFKALHALGATADKALFIGDSEVDIRAAKNAGVTCVGVTWGFRDKAELAREGADYLIDRPAELADILA